MADIIGESYFSPLLMSIGRHKRYVHHSNRFVFDIKWNGNNTDNFRDHLKETIENASEEKDIKEADSFIAISHFLYFRNIDENYKQDTLPVYLSGSYRGHAYIFFNFFAFIGNALTPYRNLYRTFTSSFGEKNERLEQYISKNTLKENDSALPWRIRNNIKHKYNLFLPINSIEWMESLYYGIGGKLDSVNKTVESRNNLKNHDSFLHILDNEQGELDGTDEPEDEDITQDPEDVGDDPPVSQQSKNLTKLNLKPLQNNNNNDVGPADPRYLWAFWQVIDEELSGDKGDRTAYIEAFRNHPIIKIMYSDIDENSNNNRGLSKWFYSLYNKLFQMSYKKAHNAWYQEERTTRKGKSK